MAVFSRIVSPRRQPRGDAAEAMDRKRQRQAALEVEQLKAFNEQNRDKIGEFLGSTFYRTNEQWPFLRDEANHPMICTRYYPTLRIAIDILPRLEAGMENEIETKRRRLKGVGVRYAMLTYDMELIDLRSQVGLA